MTNALVTGASRGLGLALVKELLNRGYGVIALDYTISTDLQALAVYDALEIHKCDITDTAAVQACAANTKFTALDLIINNAGVWLEKDRRFIEDPLFDYDIIFKEYDVNAVGVLRIAQAFMPLLLQGNRKVMLNVSSEAGSIGECHRECEYGYCMSKAAQNMASRILQRAYVDKGVKVYCFHPGWMVTPQGMAGAKDGEFPDQPPEETAVVMVDLAEGEPRDGMYYDVWGKEREW